MALVLLAAGQARRFGGGKLSASLDGQPLVLHAVSALQEMAFSAGRFAVTSAQTPPLGGHGFTPIRLHPDGAPLSRSLALGIAAARQAGATAAMIVLGDMPRVPTRHYRAMARHFDGDRLATLVDGRKQVPAIFAARHFPALMALSGDRGAGALLQDAMALTLEAALAADIDTRDDLARAARQPAPDGKHGQPTACVKKTKG